MVSDFGKLAVLLLALVGGLAVVLVGVITHDAAATTVGVGIIGPVVGYVTGNGVLARSGRAPSPVLVPRYPHQPGDEETEP